MPRDLPLLAFPDYETLPYDRFSPHPDIISQRLRTLARLPMLARGILLADLPTAMQRLAPRNFIDAHSLQTRRRRGARSRAVSTPADGRRLCQRPAGRYTGRVRDSWLALRSLPDGKRCAVAYRSRRPADRQHPQFRLRDAAHHRPAREDRAAAGARVQSRARLDPRLPAPLPHALRGRSHADASVPRRRRRARTRRHRVLLAALLRVHLHALRLSARRRSARAAGEHRRRAGCGDGARSRSGTRSTATTSNIRYSPLRNCSSSRGSGSARARARPCAERRDRRRRGGRRRCVAVGGRGA